MKKAILLSFAVILGTTVALQAEFQVNTYANDNQEHPAIAMDPAGNFVVVWQSKGQDGSGDGVYGRRFDAAGMALDSEFQINNTIGGYQDDPDVAMDGEGNFVVVWEGPDVDGEGVYARLYSANGQPRTDEFPVNSFTADRQKEPRVAMNDSGAFVIVWEWPEPLPGNRAHWHVMGRLYDASGVPQGTDFEISQLLHGYVPDVAMDESGDFVVAWRGTPVNPPVDSYVRCRMYNADGTPKGNAVQITGGNYTYFSSIATNSSGSFVITWSYHPDPSQRDVYAQRFDPDGNTITGPYMVNTYTTGGQDQSSAAMHDSGELVVVWFSEGQDGSSHGVFGQRYNSVSMPVDQEFQLNTYTLNEQWYPDIALSESGRFAVVWQSQGQDGSGYGIFAQFGQLPRQLTYYVDADAAGANNGSSWFDAFNDLQDALAVALTGDEIRVAQGVYKPTIYTKPPQPPPPPSGSNGQEIAAMSDNRTATFQLKNGVVIKGGYAGFGHPDPNARDIDVYKTILSGDIKGDDGPDFANNDENSLHIVTGSSCDETAVLDGFTITAGHGVTENRRGGGMCNYDGSPTVSNCTFSNNLVSDGFGGGMYNEGGSPTLSNCIFSGNSAGENGGGGGMYNASSSPSLTDCTFSGNSSYGGGGMCNDDSNPVLTNCTFNGNWVIGQGGGVYNRNESSPILTNCTFSGNSANSGGGMNNSNSSSPTVTNCTFSGNSAYGGGGMFNFDRSNPMMTNCTFSSNSASKDGGGMQNRSSSPTVTNCTFIGNLAGEDGGGMDNSESSPTLINCTFASNSAIYGGGMYNKFGSSRPTLTNCILWDDRPQEVYLAMGATAVITYSDVQGGWPGDGNIDTDPCFVQPPYFGLVSYWKLDEAGGTTAYDSVGFNHGNVYGAQWTDGRIGSALSFDGSGDFVSVPHDASLNITGDITISAWVYVTIGGSYQAIVTKCVRGGPRDNPFDFRTNTSAEPQLAFVRADALRHERVYSRTRISLGEWHHVVVRVENKVPDFYIDGVDAGKWADTTFTKTPTGNIRPLLIGARDDGLYFNGKIDEVAIYDRALSAEEIRQVYESPDYRLQPDSPCINAGDPDYVAEPNETDLDGKPRVIAGRIDMGAYEFNHIPIADAGPDQIIEAQAPWGAAATLDASGSSDADSTPGTNDDIVYFDWHKVDPCAPNADVFIGSGRIIDCNLSFGEHIIILEVIDRAGASDVDEVTIVIQDTTQPVFTTIPQDLTVECDGNYNVAELNAWLAGVAAVDKCGSVTITNDFVGIPNECGATGSATVTWTAEDEYGNTATTTATFTIVDTTPPEFEFSITPTVLWPPTHKMVKITPSWTVSDECDASPDVLLVSIVMNEGDNTIGDGHTTDDIQIGDDGTIYLRSERSGTGNDRLYTITYQAVDDCGNAAVRSATVTVPHDRR